MVFFENTEFSLPVSGLLALASVCLLNSVFTRDWQTVSRTDLWSTLTLSVTVIFFSFWSAGRAFQNLEFSSFRLFFSNTLLLVVFLFYETGIASRSRVFLLGNRMNELVMLQNQQISVVHAESRTWQEKIHVLSNTLSTVQQDLQTIRTIPPSQTADFKKTSEDLQSARKQCAELQSRQFHSSAFIHLILEKIQARNPDLKMSFAIALPEDSSFSRDDLAYILYLLFVQECAFRPAGSVEIRCFSQAGQILIRAEPLQKISSEQIYLLTQFIAPWKGEIRQDGRSLIIILDDEKTESEDSQPARI